MGTKHQTSDFYSGFHPVQSIQRHLQTVNEHERSREQRSVKGEQQRKERDAQHGGKPPSEERIEAGQAQGQGQAHEEQKQKQDPSKKDETGRSSAWREVQDPVTRRLVRQRDVTDEEFRKGMEEAKSYQSGLRAFQSGNGRSGDEKDGKDGKVLHTAGGIRPPQYDTTTPLRTQGDNALLYPLPPAPEDTYALKTLVPSLRRRAHWALLCWSVCALAVLPSATTVLFLLFTNAAVVIGLHVAQRRLEDGLQRERLAREEARGEEVEKAAMPEGAEWLNGVLRGLWPLVNPDLFESVADTLEDVLQASLPSFVHSVKVSDLSQGLTSMRVLAVRGLPDPDMTGLHKKNKSDDGQSSESGSSHPHAPGSQSSGKDTTGQEDMGKEKGKDTEKDKEAEAPPKNEERAEQLGKVDEAQKEVQNAIEESQHGSEDAALFEESDGEYMNLEVKFAYRARKSDSHSTASRARNAHMLLTFFLKTGLANLAVPVWVELKGLIGTLRLRIQLKPDPPFLGQMTMTFMGIPRLEIDAAPLRAVSIMDVPVISAFVRRGIDAAMATYTAPSSLALDVGEMISGDDIKREVEALGVILVYIHYADDIEKSDTYGSSDPYVTVSFSRYGRALYSTRVIVDDLHPRWEESTAIVLRPEVVKSGERVAVELWDSDRFSADDMLGRAEVDLYQLLRQPGEMSRRLDDLSGSTPGSKRRGRVSWSVGFQPKAPLNEKLRTEGDDPFLPSELKDSGKYREEESAKDRKKQQDRTKRMVPTQYIRPDPEMPSGILSIQVHQISGLDVPKPKSRYIPRHPFQPGKNIDEPVGDETEDAPSSYVEVIVDDRLVYKTRVKMLSRTPFFNAGAERFVRDWRASTVMLAVRDSRINEQDPLIGVVPIELGKIFKNASQSTSWYPLSGGLGSGRLRASILFRSINYQLPPSLRGYDVGTAKIFDRIVLHAHKEETAHTLKGCYIKLRTIAGKASVSAWRASSGTKEDGDDHKSVTWSLGEKHSPIRLPVRRRYASALIIELRAKNPIRKTLIWAVSAFWVNEVLDDERMRIKIPLWDGRDQSAYKRVTQNWHSYENMDERAENPPLGTLIGTLEVDFEFSRGVDSLHARAANKLPEAKPVIDAWRAAASKGLAHNPTHTDEHVKNDDSDSDSSGSEEGEADHPDASSEHDAPKAVSPHGVHKGTPKNLLKRVRKDHDDGILDRHDHDGMHRFKPVRTAEWIKQEARDKVEQVRQHFDFTRDKSGGHVETEI